MSKPAFAWPEGRRVAVIVSVLLETWSEGKAPSYFPRTTPNKPGIPDIAGINWSTYGGKEGVWRLARILDEVELKATLFCNGRSAEIYPDAVAQYVRAGHDVAGHGYLQDEVFAQLTPEEERGRIRQTLDAIEKAGGKRPTGWITPIYGWSDHTMDIVVQEKLVWCSDALDSNLPYQQKTKSGSVVVIPWSDFVDNRALRASPQIYFDVYKETFDYLHACEPGSLINVGVHSHFGGRPLMSAMFRKVLQYLKGFPDVWFPQHAEVAQWMLDNKIEHPTYASRFFNWQ